MIYVADGQEDKQSILSNNTASPCFDRFVSELGWEVRLFTILVTMFMVKIGANSIVDDIVILFVALVPCLFTILRRCDEFALTSFGILLETWTLNAAGEFKQLRTAEGQLVSSTSTSK